MPYILQHASVLTIHHQGDYNFNGSEASKNYTCIYFHQCCVYHITYQMQVEIVISLIMVQFEQKHVAECMV
jgi:hypothetical protein